MEKSEMKATFLRVGPVTDFPEGEGRRVDVDGRSVAVFRVDGEFYALHDCCTHGEAPLSRGTVKNKTVMCPRHGAHFDLRNGDCLTLQAVRNVEAFEVKVEDGEVLVSTLGSTSPPLWATGRRLDD
jgi:3-phenylpropionate/trans-cinnamate dioxygenase ferredoxin subunit